MTTPKYTPSEATTRKFYGKPISLGEAIQATEALVDYYEALKNGWPAMPPKPHRSLDYLLRCNAIVDLHLTATNRGLKGIALRNWTLDSDQVIYTWLYAYKLRTDKPVVTLGGVSLVFHEKSEVK